MSRSHPTNAGDDSKGRYGRWTGNNILWIIIPGVLSILISSILSAKTHAVEWFVLVPLGFGLPYGILTAFVEGKPPGNLRHTITDKLEKSSVRVAWDEFEPFRHPLLPRFEVPRAKVTHPPSLWIYDNLLVAGDMGLNSAVTIGFRIDCEAMDQATSAAKDRFEDSLGTLLNRLSPDMRVQVQWMVSNDYADVLEKYLSEKGGLPISQVIRTKRAQELAGRMERRELRRETCYLFLSMKLSQDLGLSLNRKKLRYIHENLWLELIGYFAQVEQLTTSILSQAHLKLSRLDNQGFIDVAHHFVNADEVRLGIHPSTYDPTLTVQEHVMHSDVTKLEDGMLRIGNVFHSVLTLTRLPQSVNIGILNTLLKNRMQDYSVTVNVVVKDRQKEIDKEEAQLERLLGDFAQQQHLVSLAGAIKKKTKKIDELSAGYKFPFEIEFIVRAWDADKEKLRQKINALKAALSQMGGAQSYEETKAARTFFYQSFPGWPWGMDSSRRRYAETPVVACMLPISSSFEGMLDGAEALFESATGSLVGIKTFIGGVPQNCVVMGDVRVGKSATLSEFLLQTDPFFEFSAIIDEGGSYLELCRLTGCKPIVVTPDADITINPYQTDGLPLSAWHLNAAKGITAQLIGVMNDEEKQAKREAQIGHVLQEVYKDYYQDWKNHNEEEHHRLEVLAAAFTDWRGKQTWRDEGMLEQFQEYRSAPQAQESRFLETVQNYDLGKLNKLKQSEEFKDLVQRLSYAFIPTESQPQLSNIVDAFPVVDTTYARPDELKDLALQLAAWGRGGDHGVLVDGPSNVSLKQRYVYMELGSIPESDVKLKQIVSFLQVNQLRNHIISMPRKMRKRVVIEEARRVLGTSHGTKLISEFYAQMPKFGCWVCSVTQQFDAFMQSSIRPVVMGNSSMFFLLRQRDNDDVKNLTEHLKLSETMGAAVQSFPSPSSMPGEKYAMFAYVHRLSPTDKMGICVNRLSKEALFIAASNADEVGSKREAIKAHQGDVWKAMQHAAAA